VILLEAHANLEQLTLTKQQVRFKNLVAQEYADLVYNGLWFTSHHRDLAQYVVSTQRHVTGDVRVRLWHGTTTVIGRRADRSLYMQSLATYEKEGDLFDQSHAQGFIKLHGLQAQVQAQAQMLLEPGQDLLRLAAPSE
jgi:argininosuccinate synthase